MEDAEEHLEAIELLRQALDVHRQRNDRRGEASALRSLGWAYWVRELEGDPEAADFSYSYNEQALELLSEFGDPLSQTQALSMEADVLQADGDLSAAEAAARQAIDTAERAGLVIWQALSYMRLGTSLWSQGRHREAVAAELEAIELHRSIDNWIGMATAFMNLGEFHEALDELEEAETSYLQAVDVAEKGELPGRRANALRRLAGCLNLQDRHDEALVALGQVDGRLDESPFFHVEVGRAHAGLGQWQLAAEALLKAKQLSDSDWTDEDQELLEAYLQRAA